jgi:hypothetical protein
MPAITVRDGVEYHYEDSGAPGGGGNYATFIAFHGMGFSGGE